MNQNWKTAFRSFYYAAAPAPADIVLPPTRTALLIIDIQNTYLESPSDPAEAARWQPFLDRMHATVIPNTQSLLESCRRRGVPVMFARIATQTRNGCERSLSHCKPGFNDLLLPGDDGPSQIVEELAPRSDEIVIEKITDSALTGSNLRLMMSNMGIRHVICAGIFTDQCVSSTVRSLADESFDVVVVEDACAAATDALHCHELEVINMIYCQVAWRSDVEGFLDAGTPRE